MFTELEIGAWFAKHLITIFLVSLIGVFIGLTWHYHSAYEAKSETLKTFQQSVENQNREAAATLKTLTDDRDKKQKALDQQAKDQEQKDATAKSEIKRLNDQLLNQPVRVRVVAASRASSGSTASNSATTAIASAADQAATDWVLPESNSRRLADALSEVETLSAAYNSCRAVVMPP